MSAHGGLIYIIVIHCNTKQYNVIQGDIEHQLSSTFWLISSVHTYGHVMQKMRHDSADRMQSFYEQLSK